MNYYTRAPELVSRTRKFALRIIEFFPGFHEHRWPKYSEGNCFVRGRP